MVDDQLDLFPVDLPTGLGWPDRPRLLLSYAYADRLPADGWDTLIGTAQDTDIIVDSGAFTALASGVDVDHDAYLQFLLDHADRIRFALSLDVIGDAEATLVNYRYGVEALEGRVQLLPTWHIGSPWSYLESYCEMTDYVAFGGAVPFGKNPALLWRVLRHAHDITTAAGVKVHGLGITGRRVMFQLPWSSVDSSAWTSFGRFARIMLANREGRIAGIDDIGKGYPLSPESAEIVYHYGLDPNPMSAVGYGTTEWAKTIDPENAAELHHRIRSTHHQASIRAFMYFETVKRKTTPDFRVYFAAQANKQGPTSRDREVDFVKAAHALGNPYHYTATEGTTS